MARRRGVADEEGQQEPEEPQHQEDQEEELNQEDRQGSDGENHGEQNDSQNDSTEYDPQDSREAELVKEMINAGILYVLSLEHTRKYIKKVDFKKHVMYRMKSKVTTPLYKQVIEGVQDNLRTMFGMELVAVPPREVPESLMTSAHRNKKRKVASKTNNSTANRDQGESVEGQIKEPAELSADAMLLRSILPASFRHIIGAAGSKFDREYEGLIAIIVMLIAFNDGIISRPVLTEKLQSFGLERSGNIDDALSQMRRDRYVDQEMERTGDHSVAKLYLLPRSKVEFTPEALVKSYKAIVETVLGPGAFEDDAEKDELAKLEKQLEPQFSIVQSTS